MSPIFGRDDPNEDIVDATEKLLATVRQKRLVLFVGAGVSAAPPTGLPAWRDFNRVVVRSLASGAAAEVGPQDADAAAALILARHEHEKLPPEYQAQVLAELLHKRYFEVLRQLDSDRPNASHLAIARLARVGGVRAIVTTNFDRLIERAFAAADVPLEAHFGHEHFATLAVDLARFDGPGTPCQLLKLHGSVEDPGTLIDTLAQRKRGFPAPLLDCVRHLLQSGHWLFLGFSGLDLEAEPNYLGLMQEADAATGFTWLVRSHATPTAAVVRLKNRYGDRAMLEKGDLPEWLIDHVSAVDPAARAWIDERLQDVPSDARRTSAPSLDDGAAAWARNLTPAMCAIALAQLVATCSEPKAAAQLVETLLTSIDESGRATPSSGLELMRMHAANSLGILLAGLGRHDEAVRWLKLAVDIAGQAADDDTRDRIRGNLAVSLETLGHVAEAREMYQAALDGYRARGEPAVISFGLIGLANHCIRQRRTDEARQLATEAVEWARRAGDERMRGTALGSLGMIAKQKGEYADALGIFGEVERLFARLGNDEAVAAAAGNRGEVLAALGRLDEAEQLQLSVLEVNRRLERRDNEGANYLDLGTLNRQRGNLDAAKHWFDAAVEVFRSIGDPSNEAFALYRLASIASDQQQFEKAIELASSALPLVEKRNPGFAADLWEQVGRANLSLGWISRAERAYRNCIGLAEPLDRDALLASSWQNLGLTLLLQQRNDEASAAFTRALELWGLHADPQQLEYCRLCDAAVRLDSRIAALSDAGHATPDPAEARAAAREMLTLYPDLVAMYRSIGAMQLVAAFSASAASTARFVGDVGAACDWHREAADVYEAIGLTAQATDQRSRREALIR